MLSNEELNTVLDAVLRRGVLQDAQRLEDTSGVLQGHVEVDGRRVTLQLDLRPPFPLTLPRITLHPWDALGFIPHVNGRGVVCYQDPEGLVMDRYRPVDLASYAVESACDLLADGVSGRNRSDFADEWEVYWASCSEVELISVLDPPRRVETVMTVKQVLEGNTTIRYVASKISQVERFWSGLAAGAVQSEKPVLYVPLKTEPLPVPPKPGDPFWNVPHAQRFIREHVPSSQRRRLANKANRLWNKHPSDTALVVLHLPRPSGGGTLFGIEFSGVKKHPLLDHGYAKSARAVRLRRWDSSLLVPRGGGDAGLTTKRVLIAGCGAIGGHIAVELARAGVLRLTLLDHDNLHEENLFRHVLGRAYWLKNKAIALRDHLQANLPYVEAEALPYSFEVALKNKQVRLEKYDLVVCAMGNPTVELDINTRVHTQFRTTPVVFTWVEPYGIGGHALLVNNCSGRGCFECLYTPPKETSEPLQNRAAFAAPGQHFGKALSGCGSLHTPYGSADATQTALLAVRLTLDVLAKREKHNPLRSWKGDAAALKRAGFVVSHRYHLSQHELDEQQYDYPSRRCRVCYAGGDKA